MLAAHDPNFGTANYDAQNASVSDQTDTGGWVVAWQQRNTAQNTRWAIELERVGTDGLATGRAGFALVWALTELMINRPPSVPTVRSL